MQELNINRTKDEKLYHEIETIITNLQKVLNILLKNIEKSI